MDAIVSLEDCQTEPAAIPIQNVIGNAIASKVCLPRNDSLIGPVGTLGSTGTRVASTDDLFGFVETHDGVELSVELIGTFRLLADLTEYGHHHVTRQRREKSEPGA